MISSQLLGLLTHRLHAPPNCHKQALEVDEAYSRTGTMLPQYIRFDRGREPVFSRRKHERIECGAAQSRPRTSSPCGRESDKNRTMGGLTFPGIKNMYCGILCVRHANTLSEIEPASQITLSPLSRKKVTTKTRNWHTTYATPHKLICALTLILDNSGPKSFSQFAH